MSLNLETDKSRDIATLVLHAMKNAESIPALTGEQKKHVVLRELERIFALRGTPFPYEVVSSFIDLLIAVDKHSVHIHRLRKWVCGC